MKSADLQEKSLPNDDRKALHNIMIAIDGFSDRQGAAG